MTTPTREQVVQWINRSGIAETNYVDMYVAHISNLEALVVMARADLEATIAEQAKLITELSKGRS